MRPGPHEGHLSSQAMGDGHRGQAQSHVPGGDLLAGTRALYPRNGQIVAAETARSAEKTGVDQRKLKSWPKEGHEVCERGQDGRQQDSHSRAVSLVARTPHCALPRRFWSQMAPATFLPQVSCGLARSRSHGAPCLPLPLC